jgi:hypothetical protein
MGMKKMLHGNDLKNPPETFEIDTYSMTSRDRSPGLVSKRVPEGYEN